MEGPPLNEFSSLVAPDLFHRYPDFEPFARSENGSLVIDAPMPSGHGRIIVTALEMPTVRVEIHACPESRREFDDPDATFEYLDQLRVGTRAPMDQFQDYDSGGVAVLTYRYDAGHEPAFGFNFQFTTTEDGVPEEVAHELAQQEILPQSLLVDYFFHGRKCVGYVVHEDVTRSVTEENFLNVRHFLNTDVRVESVNAEPLVDDRTLIDADLRYLADEDADVRFAALSAIVGHCRLHRRRDHFDRMMDMVLPLFDSPDAATRDEVVKVASALASAGPELFRQPARELFARAVRDDAAIVRTTVPRHAAPLLYPIGGEAMPEAEQSAFAEELFPLLDDDDPEVAETTVAHLGIFDTPVATAKLLQLLESETHRSYAILALQRRLLRAGEVVPRLLTLAADGAVPADARAYALETLGHYGTEMSEVDARIEPAILDGLAHAEPMVNFGALRAMLVFEPSEMPEARILELSQSENEDARAQSFMTMVARRLESEETFAAICAGARAINATVRQCAEHAWNELFPGRPPVKPDDEGE